MFNGHAHAKSHVSETKTSQILCLGAGNESRFIPSAQTDNLAP